jgi:hypothetical protein
VSAYLDASVLLPTIVEERASSSVDDFLLASIELWFVSDFAVAEVASGLSRLVRMDRLDALDAAGRLEDFDIWRAAKTSTVDLAAADCRLANAYVRRFDLALRAPDALHVAICRRLDLALVTLDRRLAAAAEALGVSVLGPATRA